MISDHDIAEALQSKAKPSKQWQNQTLQRLRAVGVAEQEGRRVFYFFSIHSMKTLAKTTIGSIAALCLLTTGAYVAANDASPNNAFLYTLDRSFEKLELMTASLGGDVTLAHRHLAHASERVEEIDVLLETSGSTQVSLRSLIVPTVHAQSAQAQISAQVQAQINLLTEDFERSLNKAVEILEKIAKKTASRVSEATKTELAVAIEITAQALENRLQADVEATTEVNVQEDNATKKTRRAVQSTLKRTVNSAKSAVKKAKSVQVEINNETMNNDQEEEEEEMNNETMNNDQEEEEEESEVEVEVEVEVDLDAGASADLL